jgi:DNA-binding NtrC family response regulator
MSTVGVVGSVPEPVRHALSVGGNAVIDGDQADIVVAHVKGDWPVFSRGSYVIALCDSLADSGAAYRAGAAVVAPLDPEVVKHLVERARDERSVRSLAALERDAILSAMRASAGSTARAAAMLDISVRKVQYKLHEYGVPLSRKSPKNGTNH